MAVVDCLVFWWMLTTCISVSLADYNIENERRFKGDDDIILNTGKASEKIHSHHLDGKSLSNRVMTQSKTSLRNTQVLNDVRDLVKALETQTDKLKIQRSFLDQRAYEEVKTLSDMLRNNADKLDNLIKDMGFLVDVEKGEQAGNLSSQIYEKLDTMNSEIMNKLDKFDPLFISIFTMLTDISFATSLRLAHHETDMDSMLRYFRSHISTETARQTLDRNIGSVFDWYIYTEKKRSSCMEYFVEGFVHSGTYRITISNTDKQLTVHCDQTTDGGGWLIIQRRQDGSQDFYRGWSDYKNGFGNITGEFWIGNDYLHLLTQTRQELRVDLTDFDGNTAYAKYSSFAVGSGSDKYKLDISGYNGTAGDSMAYHNGAMFSTKDMDNDSGSGNCAVSFKGAWWYKSCYQSNLNGVYYNSTNVTSAGMIWGRWKSRGSLKRVEMKIRPV